MNQREDEIINSLVESGFITPFSAKNMNKRLDIIPGYTIWEKIGEGKWGIVYKARQHSLDRWVSLKILNPELADLQPFIGRFLREMNTLGKLNHTNIIRALDSGKIDNLYYIVMEYFDGVTLAQYIKSRGALSENRVLQMAHKLLSALMHVWQQHMIHRDIVPENIMVAGEEVKLCELGLVRAIAGGGELTPYPLPRRSYSYISPEQLQGRSMDYRSDVYSLGAVLYFAITGRQTIERWDCELEDLKTYKIVSPTYYQTGISKNTEQLLMTMLSMEPQRRCESPQAIWRELHAISLQQSQKKWRHFCILLLERLAWLGVVAIIFYGFISWVYPPTKLTFSAPAVLTPSKLYQKCAPAVILLEADGLLGSGVILKYQGLVIILTNAHLVKDALYVNIILKDGRKFRVKILVSSPAMDLALMIPPNNSLATIALAEKQLYIGQDVFVIGHPKGYRWSLTRGTVSGIRGDTIQTDAAINPGNSGGPLLDASGKMLGITTFIVGKNNPIGFAISNQRILKFLGIIVSRYSPRIFAIPKNQGSIQQE